MLILASLQKQWKKQESGENVCVCLTTTIVENLVIQNIISYHMELIEMSHSLQIKET